MLTTLTTPATLATVIKLPAAKIKRHHVCCVLQVNAYNAQDAGGGNYSPN